MYNPEEFEPSPVQQEYAPVIFAHDTVAHVISLDMISGKEDRENVLRVRAIGKGVLTTPLDLIESNRLGVIFTFAVSKRNLPSNATPEERIQVGDVVHLKSIINSMETVARGRRSLVPDELVCGEEIGPNWCEVHILVAIKKRERLVRPYGLFITVEDVIGATIACPVLSLWWFMTKIDISRS